MKFVQKQIVLGTYLINIDLINNTGYVSMMDNAIYPKEDSRATKRDLGFNTTTIGPITRKGLKDLKIAIEEVLKNSK
jgi:hypothetical protein